MFTDFGLEQILPMIDENTDAELKVISVSFCDPYLLILRDDSSATILEINDAGELEELDRGAGILASEWLSGCIYRPYGVDAKTLAFMMTAEGSLRVSNSLRFLACDVN
jgi:cleavage and polyadenylation specificity factor subunit 1